MTKYLLIVALLLPATGTRAQQSVFTIGPKVGYTFGSDGGVTVGFEASYFPSVKDPISDPFRAGATIDVTFWRRHISLHVGAQIIVGAVAGIDIGPTLIAEGEERSVYLGTIFFAGVGFYPYYEIIHRPDEDNFHSVGTYLKLPTAAWSGEDGWWTPRF